MPYAIYQGMNATITQEGWNQMETMAVCLNLGGEIMTLIGVLVLSALAYKVYCWTR